MSGTKEESTRRIQHTAVAPAAVAAIGFLRVHITRIGLNALLWLVSSASSPCAHAPSKVNSKFYRISEKKKKERKRESGREVVREGERERKRGGREGEEK